MSARIRAVEPLRGSASTRRGATGTGAKLAALTVAHAANYAFPVVFALVCARMLGPAQYGVVAFYTALMSYVAVLIEFGLDPIGVRQVNSDGRPSHGRQVMWNVTWAKLTICLPTCLVIGFTLLATGSAGGLSVGFAMILYLVAYSLEPGWYLRSLELVRSVMVVALVSRIGGVVLLLSIVKSREDVALAVWAYTFVAWANCIVGWLIMWQRGVIGPPQVDRAQMRALFRSGGAVVGGNLSSHSVVTVGIAVLGALADPVVTGAANMALRIRSAAVATYLPLSQMGFVRLSTLVGSDRPGAVAFGRRLFYVLMAWSLLLSLVIGLEADRIAALFYGLPEAPEAAGLLLRLVALGLPAYVAHSQFGIQGLTLFRRERAYLLISVVAAIIFFGLLFSLHASNPASYGWALLASDTWTALAAGLCLRQAAKCNDQA